MTGIYKIVNKINGKVYVGQSVDIVERWKQHGYKAFNQNELAYNSAIHAAFRKYGIENFELVVLEECAVSELDERERYWIQELDCLSPNGYNVLVGGQAYRITKTCSKCGKALDSHNKTGFCVDCYHQEIRKHIPSKEELLEVILSYKGNFTKIGLHYGVSDNAVRKWCKSYDMPTHSKDYKN